MMFGTLLRANFAPVKSHPAGSHWTCAAVQGIQVREGQLAQADSMSEDRETRLKRLRLRSWRRGTKEMDLILGSFADQRMHLLSDDELDAHEVIMAENDHDLYQWISGQAEIPEEIGPAIRLVADHFSKQKTE